MGVAVHRFDLSLHKHAGDATTVRRNKTEDLSAWINQVKIKKTVISRRRKTDLRLRAIMSNALFNAESELKMKQQERYKKWQLIKRELLFGDNSIMPEQYKHSDYDNVTGEEFISLDDFMSKVNGIKRTLER